MKRKKGFYGRCPPAPSGGANADECELGIAFLTGSIYNNGESCTDRAEEAQRWY